MSTDTEPHDSDDGAKLFESIGGTDENDVIQAASARPSVGAASGSSIKCVAGDLLERSADLRAIAIAHLGPLNHEHVDGLRLWIDPTLRPECPAVPERAGEPACR